MNTTANPAVPSPKMSPSRVRIAKPEKGLGWRPDVRFLSDSVRSEDGYSVSQFSDLMTDQTLERWKPSADPGSDIWYLLIPGIISEQWAGLFSSMFNGRYERLAVEEQEAQKQPAVNLTNQNGRCMCGCGLEVRSKFKPGHDSRLKSQLLSRLRSRAMFAKEEPEAVLFGTGDPSVIARKLGWSFLLDKV